MPRRPPRLPPLLAEFDDDEREAVLAANRAFYRAFNERDVAAHGPDLGADRRHGLPASRPGAAARARRDHGELARHPAPSRIAARCAASDEWVVGRPGLAIVVCREILPEGQLMATNTFARLERGLAHDRPSLRPGAADRDSSSRPQRSRTDARTGASCIDSSRLRYEAAILMSGRASP